MGGLRLPLLSYAARNLVFLPGVFMFIWRYFWILCLALTVSPVHAESVPAVQTDGELLYAVRLAPGQVWGDYFSWPSFPDNARAFCTTRDSRAKPTVIGKDAVRCHPVGSFGYEQTYLVVSKCSGVTVNGVCKTFTCPDASWTLNGTMCERKEPCPSDQREWNGECRPLCKFLQTVNSQTGDCECADNVSMRNNTGVEMSGDGSMPSDVCVGGCSFHIGDGIGLGGQYWYGIRSSANYKTCSGDSEFSDEPMPQKKDPPCPDGQGVMTSSSGTVACVPEGVKGAKTPEVEKKVKKETYPDGSEKTTTTTKTTDPGTGASHSHSESTSTGGMAGPAGTSTSTESVNGKGAGAKSGGGNGGGGDGCEGENCGGEGFKGPDGDLYEKKDRTIRDVLDEFNSTVSAAPVFAAARNWFSVGGMPSGCGGLSVSVPYLNTSISADSIFCGEYGALIMQIAGAVVLAAAAYAGFRMAFL